MNSIAIDNKVLKPAIKSFKKSSIILEDKITNIPLNEDNKDLISFLKENVVLTASQKRKINKYLTESVDENTTIGSVNEFYTKLSSMNRSKVPILEIKINNKWYPILAKVEKFNNMFGEWCVDLRVNLLVGDESYNKSVVLGSWTFLDESGKESKKLINDILKPYKMRLTNVAAIEQAKNLSSRLEEFKLNVNQVWDAVGPALTYNDFWGWSELSLGWKNDPVSVVIEPTLENANKRYDRYDDEKIDSWKLPFVRIFSLKHKQYLYTDIEELQTHVFDKTGIDRIILPNKMMKALRSIFNANDKNIFGDLFSGRHGGIVVLANGPSGTGKTLSSEVFAEYQERPLYSMEMGEIGISLSDVEANLTKIFARARKWNAVLLFDEADIFLSERVASDLERSAITGIFLRLLDYYQGTFFLTTNKGEGIDKAFKSRVTLYLDYPALSSETKYKIWQNMLSSAKMEVEEDLTWTDLCSQELNGRQIRNQVRLLKLMYPNKKIKTSEIKDSLEFAAI
jgi:hypothetical protein